MSTQTVKFEYDPENNILFTEDDFSITTKAEADEFIRINLEKLESIGHKVYLISRIDGLHVGAAVSEYYGGKAREVFQKYILGFARYGEDPAARMTVRTSSKKANLESNIYNTRQEAISAIESMKGASGQPAKPDASR